MLEDSMRARTMLLTVPLCLATFAAAATASQVRRDTTARARDTSRTRDTVARLDRPASYEVPVLVRRDATARRTAAVRRVLLMPLGRRHADTTKAAQQRDSSERAVVRKREEVAATQARMAGALRADLERREFAFAAERTRGALATRATAGRKSARWRQPASDTTSGWYLGVSAGAAVPTGDFKSLGYNSGLDVLVPIGWHRRSNLLGWRLDLGYSRFSGHTFTGTGPNGPLTLSNNDPQVLSATFNVTARVPLSEGGDVGLYGVGGAGLYHFRSYGRISALSAALGNDVLQSNEAILKETRSKFGGQLGAGLDFGMGGGSFYIESRIVNVIADRDDDVEFRDYFGENRGKSLRWVPIVIGVTFR